MTHVLKWAKKQCAQLMSRFLCTLISFIGKFSSYERSFQRVVIVAPVSHKNGISRGAEYQYVVLKDLGFDVIIIDSSESFRNPFFKAKHKPGSLYIFHCGGPQTANMMWSVFPSVLNAYKIAYWAWELPDPAPDWKGFDSLIDEIWTPSQFSRASLSKLSKKPIFVVPHHIQVQPERRRRDEGVFRVLTMADSRSSYSRKNPQGAINAFRRAFGSSPKAHLYVKLAGSSIDIQAFIVYHGIMPQGNITIISDRLNNEQMVELYQSSDVLLSLHRAEGFGLPMLEAMSCGTPVVGTGWSGNMDFLNHENGIIVSYKLVKVMDVDNIYKISYWADPDIDDAASQLKRLFEDRTGLEDLSIKCYDYISRSRAHIPEGM